MKQRIFLLTLLFLLILTRTNDISAKETKLNEDMFTNVESVFSEFCTKSISDVSNDL